MTTTASPPTRTVSPPPAQQRRGLGLRSFGRRGALAVVVVAWLGLWTALRGRATLEIGGAELTGFHEWLDRQRDSLAAQRDTNWLLQYGVGGISDGLNATVDFLRELISEPAFPRPFPEIGYLGVIGVFCLIAYAVAGLRSMLLVLVSLLAFGALGYWELSLDLLIVTLVAVTICVLIGLPLAIVMARSRKVDAVVTPALDLLQTLPSFAYLAPLALFFGIGPAAAVVTTALYAFPPVVRVAAHGLRHVAPTTVEASRSLGSTPWQQLRTVQLPMAKRTIVVGVNQTTMAALSMATIAALINGPGLGQPVAQALQSLDVGAAVVASLGIVIMAVMLDRVTTAASVRGELATRRGDSARLRRTALAVGVVSAGYLVYLSRTFSWAADVPESPDLGTPIADATSDASDWFIDTFRDSTQALKDGFSYGLLNPLQSVLADSPWFVSATALLAIAGIIAGRRAVVSTAICELVILGTGLWNEAMNTLTTTLVAAAFTMLIAIVVGVWMGRGRLVDTVVRPLLDTLQTLPPFVYLVPFVALFAASRFTAIVAAVAFAAPVAIKLVADGIRGVSPTTVEAARSAGSSSWQTITKVQLPMARGSVVLAANQGLLYVFSMVVIGGLVGGGGLGYLVVLGFRQAELFGKGLAAGIAITALAVMLDRIARYAVTRTGRA